MKIQPLRQRFASAMLCTVMIFAGIGDLCLPGIILVAGGALAQEPRLAGPQASVEVVAEPGLVVYIDKALAADTYLLADPKAVIATEGTLLIHDAGRKPAEFGFLVMQQQPTLQVGTVYPMPVVQGQPLQWRIDVPSQGQWAVLVFGMDKQRPQQPTLLTLTVGEQPGPGPGPGPGPAPVPDGPRVAVVVEEVQDRSPELSDLLSDLRKQLGAKHKLIEIDDDIVNASGATPDWAKPYLKLAEGLPSPCLIVVDATTNAIVYKGALPATVEKALEMIEKGSSP